MNTFSIKTPKTPPLGEQLDRPDGEPSLTSKSPCSKISESLSAMSVGGTSAEPQTESTKTPKDTKRARLCGAARKRFRRLIAAELGAEQALALCRKPWDQIPVDNPPPDPKAKKRLRSEEESPREQPKKTSRLDVTATPLPKVQYSVVAGAVRVGVRNSAPMSEDQMRLLHDALLESIAKMAGKKGVPRPRFAGFSYKTGWVLVNCENQESHDWLVGEIRQIKPWPEAELSTIPESELPRPQVGTTFIPISEAATVEKALPLLEAQNDGLNPGLWRVLHKRAEAGGTVVTFSLDDPSAETLRANNGRAGLGFKYVIFNVRGGSAAEQPNVETPRPSTSAGVQEATRSPAGTSRQRPPLRSTKGRGGATRGGTSRRGVRGGGGNRGRPRPLPKKPHTPALR
ncbi:uncharacterized protein LOC135074253 [Ostrinia nubilalis]|uniref:uncharacterized protein LOC135074253 n=1 Tax=Ostrinia nubilalis TaxID=29057 RepID=UPI0030822105